MISLKQRDEIILQYHILLWANYYRCNSYNRSRYRRLWCLPQIAYTPLNFIIKM